MGRDVIQLTTARSSRSNGRPALYDLSLDELKALLASWGEPAYRAKQLWGWLYKRLPLTFDEMTDLPTRLRERLSAETVLHRLRVVAEQLSSDGETRKLLLALPDNQMIESVLMGYEERRTACISSQAGCGMGCVFCATGQMGLLRNLTSGEIVEQVLFIERELRLRGTQRTSEERGGTRSNPLSSSEFPRVPPKTGHALTNVVLMGMGEPLANYAPTMTALRRLIDPTGFNLGQRRMTMSTVGLAPAIERFSREALQVGLAVSLHAATDELRSKMLPINRRYSLAQLMAACRDYIAQTGRRVTFEWALIQGTNDTQEQAQALVELIGGMLCHVNVIPLNPTRGYAGGPSSRERVAAFRETLERAGISCTVRVRRGIDIQAGCGQLRTEIEAAALGEHGEQF
jgi:23S rRNA (adenine2503-C2)-methyltransferase